MKTITKTAQLLFLAFSFFTITSCEKDEKQAINSLEGEWDVVSINSIYGEFLENGFSPDETISEEGQLGTFHFMESTVEYEFERNDTTYSGNSPWSLEVSKVNNGFIKTNQFTLSIENHFLFDVTFGDATKNSEKNANEAKLVQSPTETGYGVQIEISLKKK